MPAMNNIEDLLKHELEDLYSAEEQIIEGLPAMIATAKDRLLKKSLSDHLKVTKKQKARLDQVKKLLGSEKKEEMGVFARLFSKDGGSHKCVAMEGLIDESNRLMSEDEVNPEVMDAAIIAAAQKIEHYEISGYGTAKAYALQLGLKKVVTLIEATLQEEYDSDNLLTDLAVGKVNLEANGENLKSLKRLPAKKGSASKNKSTGRENGKTRNAKTKSNSRNNTGMKRKRTVSR